MISLLKDVTTVIVIFVATFYSALCFYFQKQYKYWSDRNIPHAKPNPFLGYSKPRGIVYKELYESCKNEKVYGIWNLHKPALMINDPDLIKRCLNNDFMSFHDRGIYFNEKDDQLLDSLFLQEGSKWKNLRTKLSPGFTSGQMKLLYPSMANVGNVLNEVLEELVEENKVFDVKDKLFKFTIDTMAASAFGFPANSLEDPDDMFCNMAKNWLKIKLSTFLIATLAYLAPDLARSLKFTIVPKDVTEKFLKSFGKMMRFRGVDDKEKHDLLQFLVNLQQKGHGGNSNSADDETKPEEQPISLEEAAAQTFGFFTNGFETSNATIQFAIYELAMNPEIQRKLRQEIKSTVAKYSEELTYDAIHEMEYLGRVIDETLRKYPPITNLVRTTTKDHKFPNIDLTIEKGTPVVIPVYGLHMDERYYPNPQKFDPDRFTEEVKSSRQPYTYLPFGEGPRMCIGQRFALMYIRVGLINLVRNYQFDASPQYTPIPLKIEPMSFIFTIKGEMKLKISLADHE